MAEELHCDLDEGSHHGSSDGSSKSSVEDAHEQSNVVMNSSHEMPDKMEDVLDLDYDEGSSNGNQEKVDNVEESSDGEIVDSSDENKNKEGENGDREEGEIVDSDDDGEVDEPKPPRKVPIEARLTRPVAQRDKAVKTRECPYEINGSCTWGPGCKYIHRNKEAVRLFTRIRAAEETSWERGLREAREAMRRASKKREEPEFETKRLTAAPTGERVRNTRDSDSDESSPHRRSPQRHIPSLLDINTVPPRYQSRSSSRKDGVRSATRGSPCYSEDDDALSARLIRLDSGRYRDGGAYKERREIKDLGPQVRYPCGRPKRPNEGRRNAGDDGKLPPRHDKGRDSAQRSRRGSPTSSTRESRCGRISPSLDASPISSDSSTSPIRSPRKPVGAFSDKNGDKNAKKKVQSGSAMGNVTDPWARKKKVSNLSRERKGDKPRGRSSSNSSSSSVNSNEKLKRAAVSSNLSRPCRQRTPPNIKVERRLSPPRGDIADFRIPKKHRLSREQTSSTKRGPSERDGAITRKNVKADTKKTRASDFVLDGEVQDGIEGHGAENISDSESVPSGSRSSSISSSSSGTSARSRSASPALPAKYRHAGNKDGMPTSTQKGAAPAPQADDEQKVKSSGKTPSKIKRAASSPKLRQMSPSPSPPPPPPPPDEASNRRRQREKSPTPPPPPPPLPLISEFVLERQARKGRPPPEKRSSVEKTRRDRSPPKKKAKSTNEEKERRKRELLEQLQAVEAELKKRQAAAAAASAAVV